MSNIFDIKTGVIPGLLLFLSACGGGASGGTGYYETGTTYDPAPYSDVYSTPQQLPEGLYLTFAYPYTSVDSLIVMESAHCTPYYPGDCVVFDGSPHDLVTSEKVFVVSNGQIYYRLSDLYDNPYTYAEYWYSMNAYGDDYDEVKTINEAKITFEEHSYGPRRWIITVEDTERHFWIRNTSFLYQDYALIRFDDEFVYWEFEQDDLGVFDDHISHRLFAYFEPAASNYLGLNWHDISIWEYEIIETRSIDPFTTLYYSNIPEGLTCVVPVDFLGHFSGELGDAGCQYNLDSAEFVDAQWYRRYDLDFY